MCTRDRYCFGKGGGGAQHFKFKYEHKFNLVCEMTKSKPTTVAENEKSPVRRSAPLLSDEH